MAKNNSRRLSMLVTAQTFGNLEKLRKMAGYGNVGQVVDKLVREKMIQLRMWETKQEVRTRRGNPHPTRLTPGHLPPGEGFGRSAPGDRGQGRHG